MNTSSIPEKGLFPASRGSACCFVKIHAKMLLSATKTHGQSTHGSYLQVFARFEGM